METVPSGIQRALRRTALGMIGLAVIAGTASAQDRRDDQFYFPGSFNWQFLANYPEAARLFNAFDYGHAVLYEKLLTKPSDLQAELESRQFDFLTKDLLIRPPRFAIAEEVIEPTYSKLVWQAKQMFDWAHLLHRQIYDVYADERLSWAQRDARIEQLTDYYLSRPEYAFRPVPKSMALMDEQYYSQVFRKGYPKFNGLIWAYHWLQVGLYEPLIIGATPAEKKAGVQATLARFWSMLNEPPANLPKVMPMTSAIAPRFSAAHPRAAVIFDNLHMMHDIISDILAADTVPRADKRKVIYAALAEFRDTTRNVMTLAEWRGMAQMMGGIGMMGGPASGLLSPLASGEPMPGMTGMQHGASPAHDTASRSMPGMVMPSRPEPRPGTSDSAVAHPPMPGMVMPEDGSAQNQLLEALLRDPVIVRRIEAVPTLRRLRLEGASQVVTPAVPAAPGRSVRPSGRVRPKGAASRDTTNSRPKPMSPMPGMPGMKHP